ncbi:MAG: DEAD/DEAH box helicase [Verrucomicrobiae bacterium]|nr:DEAD/DEAH box helicase [Verrucomicrobiae bacterium]
MNPRHLEFLGELELFEARLLSWSLVDGSFSRDELWDFAADFLDRHQLADDPRDWIDSMEDAGLLFRWDADDGRRYRTRMAESIRLMARLKQLFPRHFSGTPTWQGAPNLVSDFRFILRPRKYPDRSHPAADYIAGWANGPPRLSGLQVAVLRALTGAESPANQVMLAGFQVRSTTRILRLAGQPTSGTQGLANQSVSSATVICAGTGSGKTLAFYLPALTHLTGSIESDASSWTRALALYPRNELLKDQFAETLRQIRKVNPLLAGKGKRCLVIGAFFGPTPDRASKVAEKWHWHAAGRICPFLSCPSCGSPLVWDVGDINSGIERLRCTDSECAGTVGPDEVRLTRDSMRKNPPDLLFTTTEMMNQRLSDKRHWHLFGVGQSPAKRPSLVLMDEAHTCAGNQGAQIAYLIRRWRYRTAAKPHFVGLSATLMEAPAFFSQLTGVTPANVEEISPAHEEMISEGMEYMIALRGDPMSGASLLSTTIQTVMLMRRVLDPPGPGALGAYGRKVYVFTDDLDVTNRMYTNVLDAEGLREDWRPPYRSIPDPQRHPGGSLANLRARNLDSEESRFVNGQSWRLPEDLGHHLNPASNLHVGRVSSQDTGVDSWAEIIVATASLEVGFNDPEVGVVVQHKAPRDPASFLQRKGRAGRQRVMRPWTVLVLSDYGRDRLAYQGYDLLFDPELRPRDLPLANRHVRKMQAVHALMDWLGRELDAGHVWQDASAPASYPNGRDIQKRISALVGEVLEGTEKQEQLVQWLRGALAIRNDKEIDHLLWSPPRALMTAVIPTLHRRLTTGWLRGDVPEGEHFIPHHPLPEFIANTLFGDLNLAEVAIHAPTRNATAVMETPTMRIAHALREFAPGRVSKRFAVRERDLRHWIPVDPAGPPVQAVDIHSFCSAESLENLGNFLIRNSDGSVREVPVVRPFAFQLRNDAPLAIRDSSNAFPRWHSQILPPPDPEAGVTIDLPAISRWTSLIREIRFFVHRYFEPAVIRRFTTGAEATLQLKDSSPVISSCFTLDGADAALGFTFEADAIRFQIRLPENWNPWDSSPRTEMIRSLRSARFRWRMETDEHLLRHASVFDIGWLAEIVLAAITATAVMRAISLPEAWQLLRSPDRPFDLGDVPALIFQTVPSDTDPLGQSSTQRELHLRHLLGEPEVLSAIESIVPELWAARTDDWAPWLTERFLTTFGAAAREAIQQICPDADVDTLVIDLDPGPGRDGLNRHDSDVAEIWVSEDTPGGGGMIERLLPLLAEHPQRFLDLILGALGTGDFETTDLELVRILRMLSDGSTEGQALVGAIASMRSSSTLHGLAESFRNLTSILRDRGFRVTHPVLTALNTRILKPGSTSATDELIGGMMERWRKEEERLGVEIEARPFAHALSSDDSLDISLGSSQLPLGTGDRRTWRLGSLYSLMWPRGAQARNHALMLRNPYGTCLPAERLLVTSLLGPPEPSIELDAPDWRSRFEEGLVSERRIRLTAPAPAFQRLRSAAISLLVRPIDTGLILLYPRIRGISRDPDSWDVLWDIVAPGIIAPPDDADEEPTTSRFIVKTSATNRDDIRDLLESLFAAELINPGPEIWIVSPWVSDIPLLDNRAGAYSGLEPSWPKRNITLAELLAHALKLNPATVIRIVTRPDSTNIRFTERLRFLAELDGNGDRLQIDNQRPELHTKGIATHSFALIGSMNLTHNGLSVLEEAVDLNIDPARIAQFLIALKGYYAG